MSGPIERMLDLIERGLAWFAPEARLRKLGFLPTELVIRRINFSELATLLPEAGGGFDVVLADLGVSSMQIDNPARGFSFRFDAPLDMRMDTTRGDTAADFLAGADERRIAEVIRDYGEERFAVPIAKALVARRDGGAPVRTTAELAQVVARAVKTREPGQDPATRTFQALRIHVNRELGELEDALEAALTMLAPGGRLAVISFHSLEDRIVKTFIARESRSEVDRRAPFAPEKPHRLKALGLIDKIVNEPVGGAHRDMKQAAAFLKRALADAYRQISDLKLKELLDRRYERLQSYGRFTDTKAGK